MVSHLPGYSQICASTKQNKTKQNKTKQNKTKQNKNNEVIASCIYFWKPATYISGEWSKFDSTKNVDKYCALSGINVY
jgi:hypothetical protein